MLSAAPLVSEDGADQGVVCVAVDLTVHKAAERTIRHLAYHDFLTDLPNRAALQDLADAILDRARRQQRMAAFLFLGLDRFKLVNDSLGHFTGDELLRRIANLLRDAAGSTNALVRLGGDEFVIVLADLVDGEVALQHAEAIIRRLDEHEFTIDS